MTTRFNPDTPVPTIRHKPMFHETAKVYPYVKAWFGSDMMAMIKRDYDDYDGHVDLRTIVARRAMMIRRANRDYIAATQSLPEFRAVGRHPDAYIVQSGSGEPSTGYPLRNTDNDWSAPNVAPEYTFPSYASNVANWKTIQS